MLSKTTLVLATCVATLVTAERADARVYAQRCEAYSSHSNPDYGFGRCVTVHLRDVAVGTPSRPEVRPPRPNGSPRPWADLPSS